MIKKFQLRREDGQGLAELIIILVLVTLVTMVSLRIMKRTAEGSIAVDADGKSALIGDPSSPAQIIKDAKEKLKDQPKTEEDADGDDE